MSSSAWPCLVRRVPISICSFFQCLAVFTMESRKDKNKNENRGEGVSRVTGRVRIYCQLCSREFRL